MSEWRDPTGEMAAWLAAVIFVLGGAAGIGAFVNGQLELAIVIVVSLLFLLWLMWPGSSSLEPSRPRSTSNSVRQKRHKKRKALAVWERR